MSFPANTRKHWSNRMHFLYSVSSLRFQGQTFFRSDIINPIRPLIYKDTPHQNEIKINTEIFNYLMIYVTKYINNNRSSYFYS